MKKFLSLGLLLLSIIANANPCIKIYNKNGEISFDDYRNTNSRPIHVYLELLGNGFKTKLESGMPMRWLDSGGGYSFAGFNSASLKPYLIVDVINAQDNWDRILRWKELGYPFQGTVETLKNLMFPLESVGIKTNDLYSKEERGPYFFNDQWKPIAMDRLITQYSKLAKAKKFNYLPGFVENVLPTRDQSYDLISDLYGAYYYSGSRAELVDVYYDKLGPEGEGYVIVGAVERELKIVGDKLVEAEKTHSPITQVYVDDGSTIEFYRFLVETYPTVFSLVKGGSHQHETTLLVIKKDPKIKFLGLTKKLKFEKSEYPETDDQLVSQLPTTVYRLIH